MDDLESLLCDLQTTTAQLKRTHLTQSQEQLSPSSSENNPLDDKEPDYAEQTIRTSMTKSVHGTGLEDLEQLLDDYDAHRGGTLPSKLNQQQQQQQRTTYTTTTTTTTTKRGQSHQQEQPRPTVESLLTELDGAVTQLNGNSNGNHKQQHQIEYHHQQQQQRSPQDHYIENQSPPASGRRSAASTVQSLDHLMGTLSDFKGKSFKKSASPTGEVTYSWSKQTTTTPDERLGTLRRRTPSPGQGQHAQHYRSESPGVMHQADQLDSMLGTLQTDMSKHGINTIPKGDCNACGKTIVGQVIIALGKLWHPEHFNCSQCGEELGHRSFFERSGQAYCEADYHNLFSPRCAYCNGAIKDKCVTALDKTWHIDHFFCAHCGKDFGEDGFHEKDGKAYCRQDFFGMFAPKCRGCKRAIQNTFITALGTHWHPECFVCQDSKCHASFNGGAFYEHDNLPYCEQHYHDRRGTTCAACTKPIAGRCVTAMEKKFHPEHFVCCFCRKELNKGIFKEHEHKPYCQKCFQKLFEGVGL